MIIVAKLIMPDFEQGLEMKALDWAISQAANEGLEYGRPKLKDIHFTFYDSKLMPYFFEWAKGSNSKRSGKIEYISSDMGKVEYSFSFEDAVCSACNLHYNKNEELSLFCDVSLSVSLQKQDLVKGKGEKAKQVVAAPIEGEPRLVECYYEDGNGTRNPEMNRGDIVFLHLKTENKIGELIDIDLGDNNRDFEYAGNRLENDIIRDFHVMHDVEKIELKILNQEA